MDGQRSHHNQAPHTVTLVKGRHTWVFGWSRGDEVELLRALSDLADNQRAGFEWFDAAVVSHQMGARLDAGIREFSDARFEE